MGRKTFETPTDCCWGGRTLFSPGIATIKAGRRVVQTDEVLAVADAAEELFICGGGRCTGNLSLADRIYLTVIHQEVVGRAVSEIPGNFVVTGKR
jgi:dihydrofolate reductase